MRLFPISVILMLTWGALAAGGSPSWAGASVAVLAVSTGILGLLERSKLSTANASNALAHRSVIVALCLLIAAIGAQLVPLPAPLVATLSPSRDVAEFERLLAVVDRRDPELVPKVVDGAPRPLSIAPARTWWGFGFAAAFALYAIGAARGLSAVSVPRLVRPVTALGIVVAFTGMYYAVSDTWSLYGLYHPPTIDPLSAPFHNKNHQAGWLVMVWSLTVGLFAGEVARGMRGVEPGWRDRTIWFSSKQANLTLLLLFAAAVMAIAILTTQSRSGAIALLFSVTVLGVVSGRSQSSRRRRGVAAASLLAVALIAFVWSGAGVMSRFAAMAWVGDGRLEAWQDSLPILRDFWLTGTGFNTYGASMRHYENLTAEMGLTFIEAHNDYLQFATEGGWLLGVPALLLAAAVGAEILRRFREGNDDTRTHWVRVGAVTGLLAIAIQSVVEFTLQMSGAAAMFATLLAIAIHHPRPRAASPERHGD